MNSQRRAYENALSTMGSSHFAIDRAAVSEDTSEEGLSEIGKTVTSDFGNILLGHVATTALSNLGKSGAALSKIGINSEDGKILSKAIASGDRRKVGQMIARLGSKKVKLGIQKLTGKTLTDEELPEEVSEQIDRVADTAGRGVPTSISQPIAKVQGEAGLELQNFKSTLGASEEGSTGISGLSEQAGSKVSSAVEQAGSKASSAIQQAGVDATKAVTDAENLSTKAAAAASKVASTASKAISTGEDVASGVATGFEDATLLSTSADDTGIGLVATGVLGLASLFVGLFSKKSKPKVVQPAYVAPNNYSVQAGLG